MTPPRSSASAGTTQERLERVARELFDFYERGGAHLDVFPGERDLPSIREWEAVPAGHRRGVRSRGAHWDPALGRGAVRLVSAFFDLTTFRSLEVSWLRCPTAAAIMARAAACVLDANAQPGRGGDDDEDEALRADAPGFGLEAAEAASGCRGWGSPPC